MKIMRFLDKDSRSALARIRAELGPEAVILSNKNVNGQVELMAAIDFDGSALEENLVTAPPAQAASAASPSLVDLQHELARLRGLLEGELSQMAWRDISSRPSTRATLYGRLIKLGLSRSLCGSIADQLPGNGDLEELWIKALGQLARRIPVRTENSEEQRSIIALVGSTGVGKTTTIAKLAARFVLRHGGRQVALVTTDCYRIGGQEQLETFAKYLGIPMAVATDGAQLKAALDKLADRKLVLIDTAGMSQRDLRLCEQFNTLNSVGHDIDTHVVLSATAQPGSLNELVQVFDRQALAGTIITKVDEATSLGGVMDVVIRNQLKLAFLSTGQKVPEDLVPAAADKLVQRAVELMKFDTGNAAGTRRDSDAYSRPIAV
jgi:flagellar biosynthesis protein FlhF